MSARQKTPLSTWGSAGEKLLSADWFIQNPGLSTDNFGRRFWSFEMTHDGFANCSVCGRFQSARGPEKTLRMQSLGRLAQAVRPFGFVPLPVLSLQASSSGTQQISKLQQRAPKSIALPVETFPCYRSLLASKSKNGFIYGKPDAIPRRAQIRHR